MKKLPTLNGKNTVKALVRAGFKELRQSGSHKILKKDNFRVTVPMHSRDLKKGTLNNIIEQAGLTVEEFISFLK
ncbi:MAG: type II toxin-antitoxin system HicA family toxin [Nitrospinota bacterium]|nr:type II toxin-antitoxin system HicA family toxin [Nitrospinota bacterium]